MKKTRRRRNLILAIRSKARMSQQSNLAVTRRHSPISSINTNNLQGWYQQRKKMNQKVRNLSNGNLVIFENGWRPNNDLIWLQDRRCEHVFKFRVNDLFESNADQACPFCHGTHDMKRYGSIEAVQEHVHGISVGQAEFLTDNVLSSSSDTYKFFCTLHRIVIEDSFDEFHERNGDVCHLCNDERRDCCNDC